MHGVRLWKLKIKIIGKFSLLFFRKSLCLIFSIRHYMQSY